MQHRDASEPAAGEKDSSGSKTTDVGDKSATASGPGGFAIQAGPGSQVTVNVGAGPPPNQPPAAGEPPSPDMSAHSLLARRAGAALIDLGAVLLLSLLAGPTLFSALLALFPPLLEAARFLAWLVPGRFPYEYNLVLALSLFNFLLVSLSYGVLFLWLGRGKTPGKRITRLIVVDLNDEPPGLALVVWRELLRHLFLLLFGLGYWYVFLNGKRYTLHDVLSDTDVVWDATLPAAPQGSAPTQKG